MQIETSVGDVLDRLSILEIKVGVLAEDDPRRKFVDAERLSLRNACMGTDFAAMDWFDLVSVNRKIWVALEQQRCLDRDEDFGDEFVRLSRLVYQLNDTRAEIKSRINLSAGSKIMEVKVYPENMRQMDGDTAYAIGSIHHYHLIEKEAVVVRARLKWLESELERLSKEIPAAMGSLDDGDSDLDGPLVVIPSSVVMDAKSKVA